jgi:putative DNA primase/helicase
VGDGFRLLQEALGIDFAEAAKRVDQIVNNIEVEPFKPDIDIDKRRKSLNDMWSGAKAPGVTTAYLQQRGIPNEIIQRVQDVRGTNECYHREYGKRYPAMLSLIRNSKGEPVSIHRTYFIMGGDKEKKIMPGIETITGGCVRLGEPDDTLVLAEGVETALAAWALTGHPAWATISAHGLESFTAIPRHVKRVIVAADNDASFTGQAAAFACAKYMKQRAKVETVVTMPKIMNTDMLDTLNELIGSNTFVGGPTDIHGGNSGQLGLMRWAP